ncbi:hypothetical protein ACQ33O_10420 [Ferruginibacter sp. SUN002]|uniref:hypothetical protein n=1 Tax=Ferruginibacter sp. SUN002 TaxID=2937789 RepID=UPI003D363D5E
MGIKVHLRSIAGKFIKKVFPVIIVVFLMTLPAIVVGQNPGDNPDAEPQAVPLDPKMSLLLIAVGAFLAVKVIQKMYRRQPVLLQNEN